MFYAKWNILDRQPSPEIPLEWIGENNPICYLHCLPISIGVDYFPVMVIVGHITATVFHTPLYAEEGAT